MKDKSQRKNTANELPSVKINRKACKGSKTWPTVQHAACSRCAVNLGVISVAPLLHLSALCIFTGCRDLESEERRRHKIWWWGTKNFYQTTVVCLLVENMRYSSSPDSYGRMKRGEEYRAVLLTVALSPASRVGVAGKERRKIRTSIVAFPVCWHQDPWRRASLLLPEGFSSFPNWLVCVCWDWGLTDKGRESSCL